MINPAMQNQMMRAPNQQYQAMTAGQPQMQAQVMPQSYQYTPPAASQMPNMQYGLQGSEAALGAGYQQALSGIQGGIDMAQQTLLGSAGGGTNYGLAGQQMYGNQAINALQGAQGYNQMLGNKAINTIGGANQQQQMFGNQALGSINNAVGMQQQFGNQALGGLNNAMAAQQQFGDRALGAINSATGAASSAINKGIGNVNTAFNEGVSALNQYIPQGTNAFNQMANFSGSGPGGAAAQQQAYDSYMESPDVAFLREQGERSVLQNARAAGGVGGNVLKELQRYGTGVASQGFNDYYNRLKGVADMGFGASQGVGSLRGQQAGIVGNLSSQQAQNALQGGQMSSNVLSNLGNNAIQGAQIGAGILGDMGSSGLQGAQLSSNVLGNMGSNTMQNANAAANIYGNLGSNYSNTAGQMANVYGDLGAGAMNASNTMANMYNNAGLSAGDYAYGTGQLLSGGRLQAGRDISAIQQAQGQGLSNIVGGGASNIAQLLSGVGDSINSQQGNLAAILANLATNTASQGGNQTSSAQFLNNTGIMKDLAALLQGAGTAAAASDVRLKENIRPAAVINGINFYHWDWNEAGKAIAGDQIGFGVIAQELINIKPEAVTIGNDGYLRVNYKMVI
jgi:Chaperone of endosialidase